MRRAFRLRIIIGLLAVALPSRHSRGQGEPVPHVDGGTRISAPPDALFEGFREADRDAARQFYKKYIDVSGMAVLASAAVDDDALRRTYDIVTHLLADRPDILEAMAKFGTRLIIIGKDQVYTDMPEYRHSRNPEYLNERVRGTGGLNVTSFGEENLLNLPGDRYDDESIGLHEFCHTIDAAIARIDPTWRTRLARTYREAVGRGLWKQAYAGSNPGEYWAEICQSYFDCNRINNWNHNHVATREQLKRYDPGGYDLVRTTFRLTPEHDWRLPVPPRAAERGVAPEQVPCRSLLHQVHLRPGVPRPRLRPGRRRSPAQGEQRHPEALRLPP